MPSNKVFVETNILLNHDFDLNNYLHVKIPIITIEELDGLKKSETVGYQARKALRNIKKAMKEKRVTVVKDYEFKLENKFLEHKNDNFILGFAYETYLDDNEYIFMTDDFNLWIKAEAYSIPCELFGFEEEDLSDKYNGIREVWLTDREYINIRDSEINQLDCFSNEYIIINNTTKDEQYLYTWNDEYLEEVKVKPITNKYLNIKDAVNPLDIYQKALIHMLQNENVKICITDSVYGSGKSYIMLHWALQQLGSGNGKYKKIYFVKSDSPPKNRKEFPAVPGDVKQKT